jgi:hypothetical protein
MNLITLLSNRLDELERDRTRVPPRKLRFGGMWLGVPVAFGLGVAFIRSDQGRRYFASSAGVLWLGFILVVAAFVVVFTLYQNRVPIRAQVVVDLVAWLVLAWSFFHFRFWDL